MVRHIAVEKQDFGVHIRKLGRKDLRNLTDYFEDSAIFQDAKQQVSLWQDKLDKAKAESDWSTIYNFMYEESLKSALFRLQLTKYEVFFNILKDQKEANISLGVRLSGLELLARQLSNCQVVPFTKKRMELIAEQAFPVRDDEMTSLALRTILLAFCVNMNSDNDTSLLELKQFQDEPELSYEPYFSSEVLPTLRNVIKSPQDYTSLVLAHTVYALTCLNLFMFFDSEAWEKEVEADLSLLLGLLDSHESTQVNEAAVAGIALLVYYSKDWNETIETVLFQLFELYQVKPPAVQVAIGKAIAFMYSLYDFSDQYTTSEIGPNTSFRFEIHTVENGQLMYELEHTAAALKKQTGSKLEPELKKIKQSISFCLSPSDQPEPMPDTYDGYDRLIFEKLDGLNIGNKKTVINFSWLQDLMYTPLVWLFESSLATSEQHNDFVSNAFYSLCSLAVLTAKQDKRKGFTRSHHMRDPAFQLRAREQQESDTWVGDRSKMRWDEVTLSNRSHDHLSKAKEQHKRQSKVDTKNMRRERMDKADSLT